MKWKEGVGVSVYLRPPATRAFIRTAKNRAPTDSCSTTRAARLVRARRPARLGADAGRRKADAVDILPGKTPQQPQRRLLKSNGDLYFTDPPYGLAELADDRARARLLRSFGCRQRQAHAADKGHDSPEGIAFSPDEKRFTSPSPTRRRPFGWRFPCSTDGTLGTGKVFADVTSEFGKAPGLPDGMKVDAKGNLFATGPGAATSFRRKANSSAAIERAKRPPTAPGQRRQRPLLVRGHVHLPGQTTTKGAGW